MLDIAGELQRWVEQGRDIAVATVVAGSGSAPRMPGAAPAVKDEGTAIGSVSDGCVEGAICEPCQHALTDGEAVLKRFGYSGEDSFAVGPTCAGVIDTLVMPFRSGDPGREMIAAISSALHTGEPNAPARFVDSPRS
ncbi:XdhC family protein [Streptomyces sp. PSKA30]|uniref:XdhC family protein n=1 Tax=Streptomyces sp. PSKA30 TaxID=2874597 RepID=UPI0035B2FA20